ncbi:MAG TPA: acyltransferase family protein, partial [Ohtaekwangia sp.]|nr:acyltransferase family protein [Ohtaekwangia sp.]
ILPYVIISIPIILFRIYDNFSSPTLPEDFQQHSPVYQFFYHLFVGSHLAPFWFISAIIVFYMTSPIFRAVDNAWFFRYIFPVILVAGMFTFRSLHNGNPLLSYVHFVPVYLLGMWASRNKAMLLTHDLLGFWTLFIVYMSITIADVSGAINLPDKISFEEVIDNGLLLFNVYIFRAIILCLMFLFLLYRFRYIRMPFLETLADYSFGIFFIHFILIAVTRKIFSIMHITVDFNVVTFLSYFTIVLLLSTIVVFVIKKLTGRFSRNLIGS